MIKRLLSGEQQYPCLQRAGFWASPPGKCNKEVFNWLNYATIVLRSSVF